MKRFLIASLLLWSTLAQAGLPPTTLSGQSATTRPTTFNFKAPYSQATATSDGGLIETGSENMLVNPGFEAATTTGWTCTVGTCTVTSTSGEFSSGKKALKVALSAQAMNVSQTVNTPSGIQKQGFVRVVYKVPSTMADFQVCSLVDGAEQNCVPTANLVKDDTFRSIEIPTVFGSTSAGIKFKTTTAYTANAFFDAAIVAQGLGLQNLSPDTDWVSYTPIISGLGTGSATATGKWRRNGDSIEIFYNWTKDGSAGSGGSAVYVSIPSGLTIDTTKLPNAGTVAGGEVYTSTTTAYTQVSDGTGLYLVNTSTSSTLTGSGVPANANYRGSMTVPIAGWSSSTNVYSASNADFGWTAFTATGSFTTNTSYSGFYKRVGDTGYFRYYLSFTGTPNSTSMTLNLPSGILIDSTKAVATNLRAGYGRARLQDSSAGVQYELSVVGSTTSVVAINRNPTDGTFLTSTSQLTEASPAALDSGDSIYVEFSIPVAGWTQGNTITASFAGVPTVPGITSERVDTFSVSYGAGTISTPCAISTTCTLYNQIGTGVSSIVQSASAGSLSINFSKTYTKVNCTASAGGSSQYVTPLVVTCSNCSGTSLLTGYTNGTTATPVVGYGTVHCQGQY